MMEVSISIQTTVFYCVGFYKFVLFIEAEMLGHKLAITFDRVEGKTISLTIAPPLLVEPFSP